MITDVYVDGFRSLSKFSMKIRPGLNILVGPNGSGKTNIITFLQFLYNVSNRGLSYAISAIGGAGNVFRKTGSERFGEQIVGRIRGNFGGLREVTNGGLGKFEYHYGFRIKSSKDYDSIYFSEQSFSIRKVVGKLEKPMKLELFPTLEEIADNSDAWDFHVTQSVNEAGVTTSKISFWDPIKLETLEYLFDGPRRSGTHSDRVAYVEKTMDEHGGADSCIIDPLSMMFRTIRQISLDLSGGNILNVVPSRIKEPEESSREPGIDSDGSGLAATLFHLTRPVDPVRRRTIYARPRQIRNFSSNLQRKTYRQIEDYIKLVNDSIEKITVSNDPFDNVLKLRVHILRYDEEVILPFSAMSEGTLKWASLITAVLTYRSIFAIEEPENFLHPRMQQEIIRIIRDNSEKRGNLSFVIMTTHSETLLNAAKPSELIVTSMTNGETKATRPRNIRQLTAAIKNTGFGLGHYYLSGIIDDA